MYYVYLPKITLFKNFIFFSLQFFIWALYFLDDLSSEYLSHTLSTNQEPVFQLTMTRSQKLISEFSNCSQFIFLFLRIKNNLTNKQLLIPKKYQSSADGPTRTKQNNDSQETCPLGSENNSSYN